MGQGKKKKLRNKKQGKMRRQKQLEELAEKEKELGEKVNNYDDNSNIMNPSYNRQKVMQKCRDSEYGSL